MSSIKAYWHCNKQCYSSPLTTESPRYTYSVLLLPRPTLHNFYQRSAQSTQMQLDIRPSPQVYTRSLGISCLRGTINWSFNDCFIFCFMWCGELFTIKSIRPKHLEFISHFANHAYHMLRFVNTIHKPLLRCICISVSDTSRASTSLGMILFMLTFVICIRGDDITYASPKLYYFTIEYRVVESTPHLHSSHDLLYMVVHIGHVDSLPHVRWYINYLTSHLQYADELYSLYLKVRARTL